MSALVFYLRLTLVALWMGAMAIVWLPFCVLFWRNPELFRLYAKFSCPVGLWLAGLRVDIQGWENLKWPEPCIFVANHQSMLDFLTMGCIAYPRAITVGKRELLAIPIWGWFYYLSGNIVINRSRSKDAIRRIQRAVDRVKRERMSILFFPEGTRNRTGYALLPFKKGAFHFAVQTGLPLQPIAVSDTREVFRPNERFLKPGGRVIVRVLPQIPVPAKETHNEKTLDQLSDAAARAIGDAMRGFATFG